MADNRKLAQGLMMMTPAMREDLAGREQDIQRGKTVELLRRAGKEMYENPIVNTAVGLSPVLGDIQAGVEAYRSAQEGDWGNAGLNAMGMLPFIPALGGITKFEKASKTAQKNAALPIEQGGLGLPKNNTAMDRAKAMGFDIDYNALHGTAAEKDFQSFKVGKGGVDELGKGIYFTDQPIYANAWAQTIQDGRVIPAIVKGGEYYDLAKEPDYVDLAARIQNRMKSGEQMHKDPNIDSMMKTWADADVQDYANSIKDQWKHDTNAVLERAGYVGANTSGYQQVPGQRVVFNPSNIRSRFAAFDPKKKDLTNILAGAAGLGVYGALQGEDEYK